MRVRGEQSETVENGMDHEEDTEENGASEHQQEKEVCRDFKKGDCRRGERCKFHHPKLDVCRDFQNGRCMRPACRFVHVSREQEETYVRSGILPGQVNNGQAMKNNVINAMAGLGFNNNNNGILGRGNFAMSGMSPAPMAEQEICRDFEKGDCRRSSRCKFYHPKLKICRDFQNQKCERESCRFLHLTREEEETYEGSGIVPDHIDKEEVKKKKVMSSPVGGVTGMNGMYGKRRRDDNVDSMAGLSNISIVSVLQENQTLKTKLAEMQQQITDLRRMNDTLYEQNSNYRNRQGVQY